MESSENDTARTLAYVFKPQKPDPYTGTIDAEECLNFMDSFEEYYTILRLHSPIWVSYVVLSLTSDARSWWRTSGLTLDTPWSEFRDAFIVRFTPPDSSNKAREALRTLKQARKSVAAYTNEFRRHLRLTPSMDKGDALYSYLTGLEPETSKHVRLRQPANLDAAVMEATIVHSILFPDGVPQVRTTPTPQPASDPMAMEIDNLRMELNALRRQVHHQPSTLPRLTDADRARLMQSGACFRCREEGHMARECPKWKGKGRAIHNMSYNEGGHPGSSGKAPSDQA